MQRIMIFGFDGAAIIQRSAHRINDTTEKSFAHRNTGRSACGSDGIACPHAWHSPQRHQQHRFVTKADDFQLRIRFAFQPGEQAHIAHRHRRAIGFNHQPHRPRNDAGGSERIDLCQAFEIRRQQRRCVRVGVLLNCVLSNPTHFYSKKPRSMLANCCSMRASMSPCSL